MTRLTSLMTLLLTLSMLFTAEVSTAQRELDPPEQSGSLVICGGGELPEDVGVILTSVVDLAYLSSIDRFSETSRIGVC